MKRLAKAAVRRGLRWYARADPRGAAHDRAVVIVLGSAWGMGGTIQAAHNLAGYLARRGYRVEVLSVFRDRDEPFLGPFPAGVKVTALDDRRSGATPPALRPVRALLRRIPSVLVHPVEDSRHWNAWVDAQLVRHLRRRTGILLTTRPSLNLIAAYLSPPGLVKVGLEQVNLRTWSRRLREAMARDYPRLDAFVTLTERDRGDYDRLLRGRVRLACIPNTARPMGGPQPDLSVPAVVAAGRLVPQKGFARLIDAFEEAVAAHPGWELRIYGRGVLRDELESAIAARGLSDCVTLAGASSELDAEMARASIFALSSRREGFPLVLIEAMSKGLAVVSFDCPTGPAEIIDDHENGLLVRAEDTRAFAAALGELMADERLRRRLGAAAALRAKEYGVDAIGSRWEALFQELEVRRP